MNLNNVERNDFNMGVKFKRAFIGYSPQLINKIIDSLEIEHKKDMEELNKESSSTLKIKQVLESKIQESMDENLKFNRYEEEISKTLMETYADTSKNLNSAKKKAEIMEREKLEIVEAYEAKLIVLQKNGKYMAEKIKSNIEKFT